MYISIHVCRYPSFHPPIYLPILSCLIVSALSYLVFSYLVLFCLFSSSSYLIVLSHLVPSINIYIYIPYLILPYVIPYTISSHLILSYLIYPWNPFTLTRGVFLRAPFFVCPSQVVTPAAAPWAGSRSLAQWPPRDLAQEILKLSLSSYVPSYMTYIPSEYPYIIHILHTIPWNVSIYIYTCNIYIYIYIHIYIYKYINIQIL